MAVASRDGARAERWAKQQGVETALGSYEELLSRPNVDAVYIPLPNSMHVEWAVRALQAGKHVLVEKPMAPKTAGVDEIFQAADRAGRVAMEGFMFAHHPLFDRVAEVVGEGTLGELSIVRSWHGFTVNDRGDIRYQPALGGGALLDLGCYCVAGTLLFTDEQPSRALASQVIDTSGVDVSTSAIVCFDSLTAVIDCSMRIPESAGLQIVGTNAQIEIPEPWFPHLEPRFWLIDRDGRRELIECAAANSYELEIRNFCDVVNGLGEPRISRALSRRIAGILELVQANAHTTTARGG